MRRASIRNAFADIIAAAGDDEASAPEVVRSSSASVSTPSRGPLKRGEKENKGPQTVKASRRSAPMAAPRAWTERTKKTTEASKETTTRANEVAVLREKMACLARENECLKARLQAREHSMAAQEFDHYHHRHLGDDDVPRETEKEPAVEEDRRWFRDERPRRRTCGSKNPSAHYSVGSVRSASVTALPPRPLSPLPFTAFAVYGGAALDGECAGRTVGHRYAVRPTELFFQVSESEDFPRSALPTFALPDGVPLELKTISEAVQLLSSDTSRARVTALKSGKRGDDVAYLVVYAVRGVERFARPSAVSRALRAAADLAATEPPAPDNDAFWSPLSAAAHLLPPQPGVSQSAAADLAVLGSRAYVALTPRGDSCAACVRFLERIAMRDRQADLNYLLEKKKTIKDARWTPEKWDADTDTDDDEKSPSCELSVHNPTRLESLVTRARSDDRLWKWLTSADAPKADVLSAAGSDTQKKNKSLKDSSSSSSKSDENKAHGESFFFERSSSSSSDTQSEICLSPQRAPSCMAAWALACVLSLVPADVIALALREVLRERSLLIVSSDVAKAGAVALGLAKSIAPLAWQGALIMTLPASEVDLLASPVPFIAGCSTLAAAVAHDVFRAEYESSSSYEKGGAAAKVTPKGGGQKNKEKPPPHKETTKEGPLEDLTVLYVDRQHDAQFVKRGNTQEAPNPRLVSRLRAAALDMDHGADVVGLLCRGLSPAQSRAVDDARSALSDFVIDLLDDLNPTQVGHYGYLDADTGNFNFEPRWFQSKLKAKVDLQLDLAETQMLHTYVDTLRRGGDVVAKTDAVAKKPNIALAGAPQQRFAL